MIGGDVDFEQERLLGAGEKKFVLESLIGPETVSRMSSYYWLALIYQSGPLDWYRAEMELGESAVESLFLEMPEEVEGRSAGAIALFDRGTFPTFSKYLFYDDTFLVALTADTSEVMSKAQSVISASEIPSAAYNREGRLNFWRTVEQTGLAILVLWNHHELTFLCKEESDFAAFSRFTRGRGLEVKDADVTTLVRHWRER